MRSAGAQMIMLVGLVAALWLLFLNVRVWPTPVGLLCWLLLSAVTTRGLFLQARQRRRAWLQAYLHPHSTLVGRLSGGVLLLAWQSVLALLVSLWLMTALATDEQPVLWWSLIASAVLLPLLNRAFAGFLVGHANPTLSAELAWRLSSVVIGGLLLVFLTVLAYRQDYPDFSGVSLQQAVWHLVDQQQARSAAALTILQGAAAAEALRLWLAQQLLPDPANSLWQALGWLWLLAQEALFVWSYLLACRGMVLLGGQR